MRPEDRGSTARSKSKGKGSLHRGESHHRSQSTHGTGGTRDDYPDDQEPIPYGYEYRDDDNRRTTEYLDPRTKYYDERSSKGSTTSSSTLTPHRYEIVDKSRDGRIRRSAPDIREDDSSPPVSQAQRDVPATPAVVSVPSDNSGIPKPPKLLSNFIDFGLTDFKAMSKYIDSREVILEQDIAEIQELATRAYQNKHNDLAERCLQRALILWKCKNMELDHAIRFVRELAKDGPAKRDFNIEFKTLKQAHREQAGAVLASPPNDRLTPIAEKMQDLSVEGPPRPSKGRTNSNEQASVPPSHSVNRRSSNFGQNQHHQLTSDALSSAPKGFSLQPNHRRKDGRPSQSTINRTLDASYVVQKHARRFFEIGRVFKVLWHQPAGANLQGQVAQNRQTSEGLFGEPIYSCNRWMVVVAEGDGHCICCPISTYGRNGLGVKKINFDDLQAHAVVFATGSKPVLYADEPELKKVAMPVDLDDPRSTIIDAASRVHFGKLHTVEHNVKVAPIGMVRDDYLPYITSYVSNELHRSMRLT